MRGHGQGGGAAELDGVVRPPIRQPPGGRHREVAGRCRVPQSAGLQLRGQGGVGVAGAEPKGHQQGMSRQVVDTAAVLGPEPCRRRAAAAGERCGPIPAQRRRRLSAAGVVVQDQAGGLIGERVLGVVGLRHRHVALRPQRRIWRRRGSGQVVDRCPVLVPGLDHRALAVVGPVGVVLIRVRPPQRHQRRPQHPGTDRSGGRGRCDGEGAGGRQDAVHARPGRVELQDLMALWRPGVGGVRQLEHQPALIAVAVIGQPADVDPAAVGAAAGRRGVFIGQRGGDVDDRRRAAAPCRICHLRPPVRSLGVLDPDVGASPQGVGLQHSGVQGGGQGDRPRAGAADRPEEDPPNGRGLGIRPQGHPERGDGPALVDRERRRSVPLGQGCHAAEAGVAVRRVQLAAGLGPVVDPDADTEYRNGLHEGAVDDSDVK